MVELNGEFYAQRLQKLIYLYLFTEYFMEISLQSSEQILDLKFVPVIGEKSSSNHLQTNTDKSTSVIIVKLQSINLLPSCYILKHRDTGTSYQLSKIYTKLHQTHKDEE